MGKEADTGAPKHSGLFAVTVAICAGIAGLGIFAPEVTATFATSLSDIAFRAADWFFMATTTGAVLLCIGLALSKYGSVKLGDEEPEFSTLSWLSMLFAAGMGTGLVFWGAAEPLTHYSGSPGVEGGTPEAAEQALTVTALHWGLHAWAIYGLAALVLAYFGFRKKKPYLPSAPLTASFKGRWVKPVGIGADTLAVVAVSFGVAGSVAMGILQLSTGISLTSTGVAEGSLTLEVGILAVLVVCYMASASTGLDKGIKWLSNINMTIAVLLMIFLLLVGPTSALLRSFVTLVGDYLSSLFSLSLKLYPYQDSRGWISGWTLTYFLWWIAWAPFVGVFIARISRGRTIREFVFGVLFAPTLFSLLWFAIFGGTGFYEEAESSGLAAMVREDVTMALFALYERLPGSTALTVISLVLVFIFLVTSVDSATFVLGMMTSGGSLNPTASRKLAWGIVIGVLGGALMLSREIDVIRALAILGAIPFTFVLLLQGSALLRALFAEGRAGLFRSRRHTDRRELVDPRHPEVAEDADDSEDAENSDDADDSEDEEAKQ
ncbi:MAG: BCCT family transporter [Deltaproteobacteria bacterium]|nr:BCCT family transporter [Deltaproteobacteria bacterium]